MQAGCDELTTIRRAGEVWAGVAQRGERAVGGAVYPGVSEEGRGERGQEEQVAGVRRAPGHGGVRSGGERSLVRFTRG